MKPSRVGFVAVVLLSVVQLVGAEEPTVRMQDIERVIRESEYHVTWQDQTVLPDLEAAWQAPNRAQNLRFYFTEDGLRVVDRTYSEQPKTGWKPVVVNSRRALSTTRVVFGTS